MQSYQQPKNIQVEKFQKHIAHYQRVWVRTKGNDFEKILSLFRDYCASWGTTHGAAIQLILVMYDGKNGFIAKHKNTLACTPDGLLLLVIREIISSRLFNQHGKMAAIYDVLESNIGFNRDKIVNGLQLLSRGLDYSMISMDGLRNLLIGYSCWSGLFIGYRSYSLENYLSNDQLDSLKYAMIYGYITPACFISNLIRHDYYLDNIKTLKILSACHNYIDLDKQASKELFKSALEKNKYSISFYLFQLAHSKVKVVNPDDCKDLRRENADFPNLIYKIYHDEYDHIDSGFLIDLLCHMKKIKNFDLCEFYALFCNKNNVIDNWEIIENSLKNDIQYEFKYILYFSIINKLLTTIEYLLITKKVDYKSPLAKEAGSFTVGSKGAFNKTISLLFKETYDDRSYAYSWYADMIGLFIKYNPSCVNRPNQYYKIDPLIYFKELAAEYKAAKYKSNLWNSVPFHRMETFERIINNMEEVRSINSTLLFLSGAQDVHSSIYLLPKDLRLYIADMMTPNIPSIYSRHFTFFGVKNPNNSAKGGYEVIGEIPCSAIRSECVLF